MAKAEAGKKYASIQYGRVHQVFDGKTFPEWNEDDIEVVEVSGIPPTEGDIWNGTSFSPYIPPAPTQEEKDEELESNAEKYAEAALPDMLDILTKLASGADKAKLKVFDDKVKAEKAKKGT